MPYNNQWLIPQRVILSQTIGLVTLEEIQAINADMLAFIRAGHQETQQLVHIFADTRRLIKQPGPLEVRHAFTHLAEPGLGEVIVAGQGNPFIHFIANFVGKVFSAKIRMYETTEQALTALQTKYPDLPDLRSAYRQQVAELATGTATKKGE